MIHSRSAQPLAVFVSAILTVGCGDAQISDPASPPPSIAQELVPNAAILPLDIFIGGLPRACSRASYRQFDFWIGKWDVYTLAGQLGGTNVVESELDGCAVEENWTDTFGGRGRSLNVYDAATGTWSQFWVFAGGGVFTPILMEGGLAGASMRMAGTKRSETGVFIPFVGRTVFSITDQVTWTPLPSGFVRQFGELAFDSDPLATSYDLEYRPVAQVTPIAETPRTVCVTRAGNNEFNFVLGEWDVRPGQGQGRGTLGEGRATFTKDLGGCLLEERASGPGRYEGWSFNSFGVFSGKWHRTYIDNLGQRLTLTGSLVNGAMVLAGTRPLPGGRSVTIRVSWIPVTADEVRQRWELSFDNGGTWKVMHELRYTRR